MNIKKIVKRLLFLGAGIKRRNKNSFMMDCMAGCNYCEGCEGYDKENSYCKFEHSQTEEYSAILRVLRECPNLIYCIKWNLKRPLP